MALLSGILFASGATRVRQAPETSGCERTRSSCGRLEPLDLIEDYRQGLLPLIVPLTLLKHHLSRYPVPERVHQQVYLHPYPKELMLRNHV
jgi:uncharacterized protein YbgA (DUF1722 family)